MVWPQIITAVSTLIAGLGGILLTQRHQRRQAADALVESRRIEQRDVLAAALSAGMEWTQTRGSVMIVLQGIAAGHVAPQAVDLTPAGQAGREFARHLIVAKLAATTPKIKEALEAVSGAYNACGSDAAVIVTEMQTALSPASVDRYWQNTLNVSRLLDTLEATAAQELRPS
jgi:hypothetical protein